MAAHVDAELSSIDNGPRVSRWNMLLCALLGALWGATLLLGLIGRAGDASALVHFAPPSTMAGLAPEGVAVFPEGQGYDGQFYYRLARSPLSDAERFDGVELDDPALRMTRIGYPTAVRVVSLGPLDTVTSMAVVNVLAFSAAGAAGAALAVRAGRACWIGLIFLAVPSMTYGASMSITDALAGALLVSALVALVGRRWILAALALSAAALTRESTLVLSVALLLTALLGGRFGVSKSDRRSQAIVAVAPLSLALLWQVVVLLTWDDIGLLGAAGHNVTVPFLGPFQTDGFFSLSSGDAVLNKLIPLGCLAVVGTAGIGLLRPATNSTSYPPLFLVFAFAVAAFVATMLGPQLLQAFRNSTRAIGEATVLAAAVALWNRNTWSRLAHGCLVLVGVVVIAWEFKVTVGLPS